MLGTGTSSAGLSLLWAVREARQLRSSVALRCCPWGVRSPRGEFLREKETKNSSLGSRPIFPAPLGLAGSITLVSEWARRVPFLGCSCVLHSDPTTRLSSACGITDPASEKGLLPPQTPRPESVPVSALSFPLGRRTGSICPDPSVSITSSFTAATFRSEKGQCRTWGRSLGAPAAKEAHASPGPQAGFPTGTVCGLSGVRGRKAGGDPAPPAGLLPSRPPETRVRARSAPVPRGSRAP